VKSAQGVSQRNTQENAENMGLICTKSKKTATQVCGGFHIFGKSGEKRGDSNRL
jgi:hypothetical protein